MKKHLFLLLLQLPCLMSHGQSGDGFTNRAGLQGSNAAAPVRGNLLEKGGAGIYLIDGFKQSGLADQHPGMSFIGATSNIPLSVNGVIDKGALAIDSSALHSLLIEKSQLRDLKITDSRLQYVMRVSNSRIERVELSLSTMIDFRGSIWYEEDTISFLKMSGVTAEIIGIQESEIGSVKMKSCTIKQTLSITDSRLEKPSYVSGTIENAGMINLRNLEFGGAGILDLRELLPSGDSYKGSEIEIDLHGVNIDKLRLNWSYFRPKWHDGESFESITATYQALMDNFRSHAQLESIQKLDREYTSYRIRHADFLGLGWLWDWWDRWFWGYGYERWRVMLWMIGLPLFYALLAIKWHNKMHDQVYRLDNFYPARGDKKLWTLHRYLRSLTYVSAIFFAFSLKLEKLQYAHKGLLFFLMTIYITGLFCLFFIVNFILKV